MIKERYRRDIDATELLTPISKDSRDIQEIMRIHNVELNELWNIMLDIFSNQFIQYMTEYGLEQWESMLDIVVTNQSITRRRDDVIRELQGARPYTLERFQEMLDSIYGTGAVTIELVHDKYELWFDVNASIMYLKDDIYTYADVIVPKNLLLLFKHTKHIQDKLYIGGYVKSRMITKLDTDTTVDNVTLRIVMSVAGYITNKHRVIRI